MGELQWPLDLIIVMGSSMAITRPLNCQRSQLTEDLSQEVERRQSKYHRPPHRENKKPAATLFRLPPTTLKAPNYSFSFDAKIIRGVNNA
jgi:hypothetical protein